LNPLIWGNFCQSYHGFNTTFNNLILSCLKASTLTITDIGLEKWNIWQNYRLLWAADKLLCKYLKKIIFPILGPAKGRKKVNINSILLLNIPACYQKKNRNHTGRYSWSRFHWSILHNCPGFLPPIVTI
jgi:hypothetical protein